MAAVGSSRSARGEMKEKGDKGRTEAGDESWLRVWVANWERNQDRDLSTIVDEALR